MPDLRAKGLNLVIGREILPGSSNLVAQIVKTDQSVGFSVFALTTNSLARQMPIIGQYERGVPVRQRGKAGVACLGRMEGFADVSIGGCRGAIQNLEDVRSLELEVEVVLYAE